METLRRRLGADHPDTLKSMGNLAVTLKAQGDFQGAREMEEEVFPTPWRRCPLALLAAAILPRVARARTLYTYPADDGDGYTLERGGQTVGRLRRADSELLEVLNLAEALARSPASIASFLEAAGSAALEEAGKIVARGVSPAA